MNLKTTLDKLKRWEDECGIGYTADGDVLEALLHDANAAHELSAEREWYRLLAMSFAQGNIGMRDREDGTNAWVGEISLSGDDCMIRYVHKTLPLDSDGLPFRTPELEQALRQALEESK